MEPHDNSVTPTRSLRFAPSETPVHRGGTLALRQTNVLQSKPPRDDIKLNKELEAKNRKLESEVASLKATNSVAMEEKQELKQKTAQLRKDADQVSQAKKKVEQERDHALKRNAELEDYKKKCEQLSTEHVALRAKIDTNRKDATEVIQGWKEHSEIADAKCKQLTEQYEKQCVELQEVKTALEREVREGASRNRALLCKDEELASEKTTNHNRGETIAKLEDQVADLQQQLEDCAAAQARQNAVESDLRQQLTAIDNLSKELNSAVIQRDAKCSELEEKLVQARRDTEDWMQAAEDANLKISGLKSSQCAVESESHNLKHDTGVLRRNLEACQKDVETLTLEKKSLTATVDDLTQRFEEAQNLCARTNEELDDTHHTLKKQEAFFTQELESRNSQLQVTQDDLQSKVDALEKLTAEAATLSEELTATQSSLNTYRSDLASTEVELETTKQALQAEALEHKECASQVTTLSARVAGLEDELKATTLAKDEAEQQVLDLKKRASAQGHSLGSADEEITTLRNQAATLTAELSASSSTIDAMEKDVADKASRIVELTEELAVANASLSEQQEENSASQGRIHALNEQLIAAEREKERVQERVAALEGTLSSEHEGTAKALATLNLQLSTLQSEHADSIEEFTRQIAANEQIIAEKGTEVESLRATTKQLQADLESTAAEVGRRNDAVKEHTETIASLELKLQTCTESITQKESMLSDNAALLLRQTDSIARITSELEAARALLAREQQSASQAESARTEQQQRASSLEQHVKSWKEKLEEKRDELQRALTKLNHLEAENETLLTEKSGLEQSVIELQRRVTDCAAREATLEADSAKLQRQLDERFGDNAAKREEIDDCYEQIKIRDDEIMRLKASIDANERATAAQATSVLSTTEQVKSLEAVNKKLNDRISELSDRLEARTRENDKLHAEVRDLNVELRNHETYDASTPQHQDMANLQQQIDAQATALHVASSSRRALEAQLEEAQDETKQYRRRAEKLESDLLSSSHTLRSAEFDLQQERDAHEIARNDLNRLRDQLRHAVTEQGNLSGQLDKAHKDLRRARDKLEAERDEHRKKATASEHDIQKLGEMRQINRNNASRMVELERQVHVLEDEVKLQAQLAERRLVQLGEAEMSLDTKAKLIVEKSKEARSHAAAKHAIARELEEANERAQILQEKYDDAKLTLSTLKPKFMEAKARLDTITKAHKQLGEDTRDYESKYNSLLQLYNDVKQRFEATDPSNAEEAIEKLQAKVHDLEAKLESANAFRETTERENRKLTTAIRCMFEEVDAKPRSPRTSRVETTKDLNVSEGNAAVTKRRKKEQ